MNRPARAYAIAVIVAGAAALAGALALGTPTWSQRFLVYLAVTALACCLKLRLPGMSGVYSLGFLTALYGLAHFSPAETLLAGCAGAFAQSLIGASKRPRSIQVAFNVGAASVALSICLALKHLLVAGGLEDNPFALMSAMACGYFVVNTLLVAGVLALVDGKPLGETCEPWYLWPLPYYLVGAVLVGLTTRPLGSLPGDAWLLVLPATYLIHFFIGLAGRGGSGEAAAQPRARVPLPPAARAYLAVVVAAGACLLLAALAAWETPNALRLVFYLGLTIAASTLKIRLPGLAGTLSVSFVPILAAIVQLGLPEVVVLAIIAAVVQTFWKAKTRPRLEQTLFNASALSLSAAATFAVCRLAVPELLSQSAVGFLVLATLLIYATDTVTVAAMLALIERKPVRALWQCCHFWTFPCYLVGAAVAGMMTAGARPSDLVSPGLILSLMGLVYVSYRAHLGRFSPSAAPSRR